MNSKHRLSRPLTPEPQGGGWFGNIVKPLVIFLLVTAIIGGRIPETLAEETGENVNLLVATLYALVGVLLSTTRLHVFASSAILFVVVAFNLPKGMALHLHESLEGLLLLPLILVSQWMAVNISRIFAFIALVIGLGLLLPSDIPTPLNVESNYLLAALVALLITPIIHILTTRRDRGI